MSYQPNNSATTAPQPAPEHTPETAPDQPNIAVRLWRRPWKSWQVLLVAVLVAVAASGGGQTPEVSPTAATPAASERDLEASEARAAEAEARVTEAEEQIAELEQLLAELEASDSDSDQAAQEGLAEQVEQLEAELAGRDEQVAALTEQIADLAAAEPEPEPEPEPEADSSAGGDYTAGAFEFSDVQVSQDFLGDFEVRARVTNTGSSRQAVGFKATLFSGGSVVGTATGVVSDFAAGATVTVEFISLDDHRDWDDIEFQVEYQL